MVCQSIVMKREFHAKFYPGISGEREHFLTWRAVNATAFLLDSLPEEHSFLFGVIMEGIALTQERKGN
jgi:hypothetical protein